MSESKTAKKAILDKFRQTLVVLYQRSPKKMSENADEWAIPCSAAARTVPPPVSGWSSSRAMLIHLHVI